MDHSQTHTLRLFCINFFNFFIEAASPDPNDISSHMKVMILTTVLVQLDKQLTVDLLSLAFCFSFLGAGAGSGRRDDRISHWDVV